MKKIIIFFVVLLAFTQTRAQLVLQGTVLDENNSPLVGAIVSSNNQPLIQSGINGEFKLSFKKPGKYVVEISFLGYQKLSDTLHVKKNLVKNFRLKLKDFLTEEVVVQATRAGGNAPFAYSNIDKATIQEKSTTQDIPYLLKNTVSLVTSSDAGAGVGYTSFRIRGSDITRINVTVNGVPLNDPESHGVWWVNMPNFSESINSLQIQRGVGTSTNGAGAFGASLNFQTNQLIRKPYTRINSEFGTFNTLQNSISFGTGILNGKFTIDGRLSKLNSDGFVDRAFSDMESYYLSAAYFGKKTMLRAIHFAGHEKTYQAWWGVPKVRLESDLLGMQRYEDHGLYSHQQTQEMINSNPRTYNYYTYDNETDNYWQKHYQFILAHNFSDNLNFNAVAHYTQGQGYYEQFKGDDDLADYGLTDVVIGNETIGSTDLIRQKWLDNDFYGLTYNLEYSNSRFNAILGGAWNQYLGSHFGKIIWAKVAENIPYDFEWYNNRGIKTDANFFAKFSYEVFNGLTVFGDFQSRQIGYKIYGIHDDLRELSTDTIYQFLNPKTGLYYILNKNNHLYASFAIANREPSRTEFRDADPGKVPQPERLKDFEFGFKHYDKSWNTEINFYNMSYKNQLIQTGEINNVGAAILTNIPESYRKGMELLVGFHLPFGLEWNGNVTLSKNKAINFTSYTDNWDYWNDPLTEDFQKKQVFEETDLIFSPNIIASGNLIYRAPKIFTFSCESKYVGRQYIDNTSSVERSLNPYFVRDMHFIFDFKTKYISNISLKFNIFNFLNVEYETNAWVYRYYYQGQYYDMDGYFPQAGRHYSLALVLKI